MKGTKQHNFNKLFIKYKIKFKAKFFSIRTKRNERQEGHFILRPLSVLPRGTQNKIIAKIKVILRKCKTLNNNEKKRDNKKIKFNYEKIRTTYSEIH